MSFTTSPGGGWWVGGWVGGGWWSDIYEIRANLNSVVVEVEVLVELGKNCKLIGAHKGDYTLPEFRISIRCALAHRNTISLKSLM